jgi:hypothetical protein
MISHVVLFKLKQFDTDAEKKEVIWTIKTGLLSLQGKIKELRHIEVGTNYELAAKSFDICLVTHFETVAGLDVYRVHPEHLKVSEFITRNIVDRAAVDFEF